MIDIDAIKDDLRMMPLTRIEVNVGQLEGLPQNPRSIEDGKYAKLKENIEKYPELLTWRSLLVYPLDNGNYVIVGGNMRYKAMSELGYTEAPVFIIPKSTPADRLKAYTILDNNGFGDWDWNLLSEWPEDMLDSWGLDLPEWEDEEGKSNTNNEEQDYRDYEPLNKDFFVFPCSILDTRKGEWVERKRQWIRSGLNSGDGRDSELTFSPTCLSPRDLSKVSKYAKDNGLLSADAARILASKGLLKSYRPTSIFDPVLCEVCYRWYNIKNGTIIDPFAGGSVRGIVASALNMQYYGNDLRNEQVEANRKNLGTISPNIISKDWLPVWTVGDSCDIDEIIRNIAPSVYKEGADMIFSCPPYADLEKYSDLKEDLSNMDYEDFICSYRKIISKCYSLLKDNRFAVFVVGDVRDKNGYYYNFVNDTVNAFIDAGFHYYGQLVLVNQIGSATIRARSAFAVRKIVKSHQNVIVAYKGDNLNENILRYETESVENCIRRFNEERIPLTNHDYVEIFYKGDATSIKATYPESINGVFPNCFEENNIEGQ